MTKYSCHMYLLMPSRKEIIQDIIKIKYLIQQICLPSILGHI
jgi:hypothetical protein